MKINLSVINHFLVCLSICFFIGLTDLSAQTSYIINPGVSVGPITRKTTEADLKRIYGKENVKDTEVGLGEGETMPGTVIFENDPKRRIEIIWKDQKRKSSPQSFHIYSEKSLWKTKEGIGLGTSLKELEKINGRAFELAGFQWDYSGMIFSWKKGKLAKMFGNTSQIVMLRLNPDYDRVAEKDLRVVASDGGFSSKHRVMQKLNPKVDSMIVTFP